MIFNKALTQRQIFTAEIVVILLFSLFPLVIELPYRSTIYLTWEGAYRMYLGQMPFQDFGMPMGYGFWIIPFLSFKILGPYMFSLIVAQGVINIISLVVVRNTLKLFNLSPIQIFLSLIVFCLSYVLINFWPWYNHTVVFYELIGLYFLLRFILKSPKIIFVIIGAFFIGLSFFTKQDTGALALFISLFLLLTDAVLEKRIKPILLFVLFYALTLLAFILPAASYEFTYWFNYGQPPHFSRINLHDFLDVIFEGSSWLKFYIIATIIISVNHFLKIQSLRDKSYLFFALFTLGILTQAMITQVTTYTPINSNIYFHCFGIAFIIYNLGAVVQFEKLGIAILAIALIFFWQSENYFKYSMKIVGKVMPGLMRRPPSNVVSMNTWSTKADSIQARPVAWASSKYKTLRRIKLPVETIKGLERIEALREVKGNTKLSCLNMTNLTSLAYELNYPLTSGPDYPLWFHKGVIIFDRETKMLCGTIERKEYDLILFEAQPNIDGFFSFDVRDCVREHYKLVDTFIAPTGYTYHTIEVYVK